MSPSKKGPSYSNPEAGLEQASVVRMFVRKFRAFTVGVGFGLLPFLVENPLPGLQPLIQIFPKNLKPVLLTLTPLLMGAIALTADFYWDKIIPQSKLARWFKISGWSFLSGLLLLIIMYKYFLIPVSWTNDIDLPESVKRDKGLNLSELYVIGWQKKSDCICVERDAECIEGLQYKPVTCWGALQVNTVELVFQLSYLTVNFGFGTLIGLSLLRKRSLRLETQKQVRKVHAAESQRQARSRPKRDRTAPD